MLSFEVTVLGCNSAIPTASRHPTSQLLNIHERYFLLDCGEAAQIQLRRYKFKLQRIDHIFISHLHGDHYLGLPGMLGTMHLLGREKPLHLYAPPGLKEILDTHHYYSKSYLDYELVHHVLEGKAPICILENTQLKVETIPMNHRIPCFGFFICEKEHLRNIIRERIEEYKIPLHEIPKIKAGKDFVNEKGKVIPNEELTLAPASPRSYAYCSDTVYNESYIGQISHANLLYHEATFSEELANRAAETLHCTARQAAAIAQKAGVKKLIIGHFSARYKEPEVLLREAKEIFENTVLAEEGNTYAVQ